MQPSLPQPSSTLSLWHRTTRSFPHLHENRLAPVPASAKYLIIGSGISGALTAWSLVDSGVRAEDVLIIEAREAVSGASGRNAGHIRPDSFRGFPGYAKFHGPEQARKILENERVVLENARKFVKEHNIDCDFNYMRTFEVALTDECVDLLSKALTAFKAAGGDVTHVKFYNGEAAQEATRVPGALCAYESPAASNHPGKLVQWILKDFISKGGKLWTHCPVTKTDRFRGIDKPNLRWEVHTPRGIVAAETVVHCTNAYAAYLLPELSKFITPRRSQVNSFVPPLSLSGADSLKHTMALRYRADHFFSVNSLNNGMVVLGGTGTRSSSDMTSEDLISFDDSKYSDRLAQNSTKEFLGLCHEPDSAALRHGEGLDHAWTGIIAMTADSAPLVGPIEGLEGQWICAGFNGHGMAGIFTCAPGLAKLISGLSWQDTGLPECFQFSTERIRRITSQSIMST
ncbi:FAD dependent oxidoreductase, partial [Penicillium longicatenatum]|uniref:FAD dependent oxidoreductase n=1 Tax=Penicillium longicatenatum TaxID=1561947 RepID=UPI002547FE03